MLVLDVTRYMSVVIFAGKTLLQPWLLLTFQKFGVKVAPYVKKGAEIICDWHFLGNVHAKKHLV